MRRLVAVLVSSAFLVAAVSAVVDAGEGWWCFSHIGADSSMCDRDRDICERVQAKSAGRGRHVSACLHQDRAVSFKYFSNISKTTEEDASATTAACRAARRFLTTQSDVRFDISRVTQCKVV